jgi:hypothetical protein
MKHLTSFWELLRFYCRITSNPSVAILFILFLLGVFPSMLRRNLFITFEFQADANRLEKRGGWGNLFVDNKPIFKPVARSRKYVQKNQGHRNLNYPL